MIIIRKPIEKELLELSNISIEIFKDNIDYDSDYKTNWSIKSVHKYFKFILKDSKSLLLVASYNDRLIGYLSASRRNDENRRSEYLEVLDLGVLDKFRSKGVGKLLILECTKWARSKGFDKLFVNSYIKNKGATCFYQNLGFNKIDISLEKEI